MDQPLYNGQSGGDERFAGKMLKAPSSAVTIAFALLLFVCSLTLAQHAVSFIDGGRMFTGVKILGLSFIALGGCFDPINFLWRYLPFTRGRVVPPAWYACFSLPLSCIGLFLFVAGWFFCLNVAGQPPDDASTASIPGY